MGEDLHLLDPLPGQEMEVVYFSVNQYLLNSNYVFIVSQDSQLSDYVGGLALLIFFFSFYSIPFSFTKAQLKNPT